jgi:tetratricopeptide (TPR) repeat protein
MKRIVFSAIIVAALAGCATQDQSPTFVAKASRQAGVATAPEAFPARLGSNHFPITTKSPEAQRAFDRGLTWAYSFGHYAAEQEFKRAAAFDPGCAMAHWGIALVNGPHINFPMVPPDKVRKAWDALAKAQSLATGLTHIEHALIDALARRYADPQPEDRSALDQAYADAMRQVWKRFPENPDVGALCAEALMDLHPWDLWTDAGAQPWTGEIVGTLERVMEMNPRHPGANHYYIHAIEASSQPDRALVAADRLGKLVPDSSHMVHMPSHIYARVGQWEKAAESNKQAMKADRLYRTAYPRPGFYGLYMAHNSHFLAFTAMMRGRSEEALRIARQMVSEIPPDFIEEYAPVVDGFTVFVPEVLMRFGRWEDILAEPAPRDGMPLAKALWHFTRTTAYTALGRMDEARKERAAFSQASEVVPEDATFGNNKSRDLLEIATLVIDGEMKAKEGDFEAATTPLEKAVELEDKLRYDEPPDWIQPVRHTLGAVLLRKGDAEAAEKVYLADLEKFPGNGWSLMGLRDALKRQGKDQEAIVADAKFRKAWANADVQPSATCYCQEEFATR